MNCAPGDLAVVVRSLGSPCWDSQLGITIRVSESIQVDTFGPLWSYTGKPRKCPHCGRDVAMFFDSALEPIRGPRKAGEAGDRRPFHAGMAA